MIIRLDGYKQGVAFNVLNVRSLTEAMLCYQFLDSFLWYDVKTSVQHDYVIFESRKFVEFFGLSDSPLEFESEKKSFDYLYHITIGF